MLDEVLIRIDDALYYEYLINMLSRLTIKIFLFFLLAGTYVLGIKSL